MGRSATVGCPHRRGPGLSPGPPGELEHGDLGESGEGCHSPVTVQVRRDGWDFARGTANIPPRSARADPSRESFQEFQLSYRCEICGKEPSYGKTVSFSTSAQPSLAAQHPADPVKHGSNTRRAAVHLLHPRRQSGEGLMAGGRQVVRPVTGRCGRPRYGQVRGLSAAGLARRFHLPHPPSGPAAPRRHGGRGRASVRHLRAGRPGRLLIATAAQFAAPSKFPVPGTG